MDRIMTLKMADAMIKNDLVSPITFKDFKTIADAIKSNKEIERESGNEGIEVYTKSSLIFFLFENLNYYEIEDYIQTFGTKIIKLCSSYDWYNGLSKIINGALEELLVDISRRVEFETVAHLYDALETFLKRPEDFELKLKKSIHKNICNIGEVSTIDTAENYKYEQLTMPNVPQKKTQANEIFSRTNFFRKENIKKNIKKYVIKNYNEETFQAFINALNKVIEELNISRFAQTQLIDKYSDVIQKLYIAVGALWLEEQAKRDVNQLTLFNFIGKEN